ncbi:MAG: L-aspartate oxidase [Calditrichales bacterium]|nr:MAG: L-aspartate oxidase [Calditrichales bacterium]
MKLDTDFLVIGSGIAGLSFALSAAKFGNVCIITKKEDKESNTNYAQGGIASVFDNADSFTNHIQDTLDAGAGICHEDSVRFMVKNGPKAIKKLIDIGVEFSLTDSEHLDLGKEGGHSHSRIVHSHDFTGREIERALIHQAKTNANITILENHIAIDLITQHQTPGKDFSKGIHCWGAYALDTDHNVVKTILSGATVLASGGCGQVYLHTTNPTIATGDGMAMAYRAGARIANMEFMQFHPTSLFHSESKSFLISEAVRGFGAVLRDKAGQPFMKKYHTKRELAPRDIVARAIDHEMKLNGESCVFLDLTMKRADDIIERFPGIYNTCLEYKIDITREWIPVVPAAHYMCGGVVVNGEGQTNINRLFACGETAFTGVHGANRLASNSLLEAVVFTDPAVRKAASIIKGYKSELPEVLPWSQEGTFNQDEWVYLVHDRHVIREVMWDYVGIMRSDFRLARAARRVDVIASEVEEFYRKTVVTGDLIELRNIATVARLIIRSAISRKESRGLHFTTDFPQRDDKNWKHDTILSQPVL